MTIKVTRFPNPYTDQVVQRRPTSKPDLKVPETLSDHCERVRGRVSRRLRSALRRPYERAAGKKGKHVSIVHRDSTDRRYLR